MFKQQTASLGFFPSTTVCRLQKPPHTNIFHKSFYETSYEAIKMIYGPFLILVYWALLSGNMKVKYFPRLTQHRCQNIHCFFTSLEIEKQYNFVQLHFRSYEHKMIVGQCHAGSFVSSKCNSAAASCILLLSDPLAQISNVSLVFCQVSCCVALERLNSSAEGQESA